MTSEPRSCPSCGQPAAPTVQFCTSCGSNLANTPPPVAPPPEAGGPSAAAGGGKAVQWVWWGIGAVALLAAVGVVLFSVLPDGPAPAATWNGCENGVCMRTTDAYDVRTGEAGGLKKTFRADAAAIHAALTFTDPDPGAEVEVRLLRDDNAVATQVLTLGAAGQGLQAITFDVPGAGLWLAGDYTVAVFVDGILLLEDGIVIEDPELPPPFPEALAGHYRCAESWDADGRGACDVVTNMDPLEIEADGWWSKGRFSGQAIAQDGRITLFLPWGEPWRDGTYDADAGTLRFEWANEGTFSVQLKGDAWSRITGFDQRMLDRLAGTYRCTSTDSEVYGESFCDSATRLRINARGEWSIDGDPGFELARTTDGEVFFFESLLGPPVWGLAQIGPDALTFLTHEGEPMLRWVKVTRPSDAERQAIVGEYECVATLDADGDQAACDLPDVLTVDGDGRWKHVYYDRGSFSSGSYLYEDDRLRLYAIGGDRVDSLEVQHGAVLVATKAEYQVFTKNGAPAPANLEPTIPLKPKEPEDYVTGKFRCVALETASGARRACPSSEDTLSLDASGTFERNMARDGWYGSTQGGSWTFLGDGSRVRLATYGGGVVADLTVRDDGVLAWPTDAGTELWTRGGEPLADEPSQASGDPAIAEDRYYCTFYRENAGEWRRCDARLDQLVLVGDGMWEWVDATTEDSGEFTVTANGTVTFDGELTDAGPAAWGPATLQDGVLTFTFDTGGAGGTSRVEFVWYPLFAPNATVLDHLAGTWSCHSVRDADLNWQTCPEDWVLEVQEDGLWGLSADGQGINAGVTYVDPDGELFLATVQYTWDGPPTWGNGYLEMGEDGLEYLAFLHNGHAVVFSPPEA